MAQFERQLREAARGSRRAEADDRACAAAAAPPPMIDNPQWLELQRRLAELRRRREQLLVDRTPLHPAVAEIDVRIADAEEQLAAVPRQIPNPQADDRADKATPISLANKAATAGRADKAATVGRADKQAAEQIAEENQQKLHDLSAAVEKARQARDEAELAEKRALEQQQARPQLVVEYAKVVQDPLVVDYGWRRLIWSTLAAGALMAFGIGGVWLGATIEPTVSSVAEVEAALGGPIIGTIPAQDPAADPAAPQRQGRDCAARRSRSDCC